MLCVYRFAQSYSSGVHDARSIELLDYWVVGVSEFGQYPMVHHVTEVFNSSPIEEVDESFFSSQPLACSLPTSSTSS